ncbi:MAG: amino acid ABC transporter [Oceanospirillaceae bacterium]|uniref:ABC transporter substrate-binding protein n=1 Tax=unclassified Thalassolituus TaxID=2624967 RepID=UPI000C0A9837|nr:MULTISPECIES: ABC transporter substrate-binding protein [unclassified Thalassolituus]MAK89773.1 amino acid ABC transporter [Thalassolituus sp.]MAS25906.1 amino acid ABC transporter [Oceanospirillaceae bacterium]MAY01132.1 amino acid ABC transporter [Oceanospirillaceae bacterium]MBL36462.1 amino acid ABC transporter [Oceanospirillaceae bacterium]MBS52173.1 amino acid ABC transporter [Oceanospirillaceae bacterium]|tara:strand:+ start:1960 stop:2709 length:750 start_codon:yes stop_codon:yes gene_type:complete
MRKLIATLCVAVSCATAPFALAGDKIRIATEGAYAPFNMVSSSGELIGFDVDIAKALCAEMKADCEIVAQDWDGIIPALLARKYDAIIASMSITEDRLKVVDFSNKYYSNVLAFVGPAGKTMDTSKAGLKGLVLGAQRSTIAGQTLEDNYGDVVDVKLYDTQDNAYLDLAAGRIDGILSDKFPAYDWLQTEDGAKFEFKGEDLDIDDEIGIAIRKGDKLKEKLNKALDAIVANGTYKEINAKYFPFDIY